MILKLIIEKLNEIMYFEVGTVREFSQRDYLNLFPYLFSRKTPMGLGNWLNIS